jgi:neutral ceramidase
LRDESRFRQFRLLGRQLAPITLLLCMASALCFGQFRVGVASVEITPPEGAPMAGYYHNRSAEGVHDPLMAKALVIERAGVRVALVSCDLLSMPGSVAQQARERIAKDPGIPASHVMISATHTHTGPVLMSGQLRYRMPEAMRQIGDQYTLSLPGRIHAAVHEAAGRLEEAKLYVARGEEPTLTFNRRFWMKDGSVGWNPGKRNPNIVRPAGPIDADVPVLYVETADGRPLAAWVNYALHLDTVGGMAYSADYPYTLAQALLAAQGNGFETLFTLGAAGNLNHIDVSTSKRQKGHDEAARIGGVLAGSVLKALRHMEPVEDGELKASARIVPLDLKPLPPGGKQKAEQTMATFDTPQAAPFLELVKAGRDLAIAAREGKPLEAEVQVFSIGREVAWIALPGEIFTELGLSIKAASPFHWTAIVTMANDNPGYIPDRKAHAQGAYEAISARVLPGSGEKLVDSASQALVQHMPPVP